MEASWQRQRGALVPSLPDTLEKVAYFHQNLYERHFLCSHPTTEERIKKRKASKNQRLGFVFSVFQYDFFR